MQTSFLSPVSLPRALRFGALLGLALLAQAALAQAVDVTGAWARATVQGQTASGVFMHLTARNGAKLVAVSTPVAGVAEVHEMRMEGDVMKMAALKDGLALPAGKTVDLQPGGYHLMLQDLKLPLKKDSSIPLSLVFVDAKGQRSTLELMVPVAMTAPGHGDHVHAMPPAQ